METLIKTPVLETKRLTLRPTRLSDSGLISLYTSDFRVARMTASIPHPNPPGAVEAFIHSCSKSDDQLHWTIDATRGFGCEVVGAMGLYPDGEIGYWLGPFFWNLGIATEAVNAVATFAEGENYPPLHATVFQENPASRRVLEKNKFAQISEGTGFSVAQNKTVKTWEMRRDP